MGRLFIQYLQSLSSLSFCPSHMHEIPTEGILIVSVRHLRSSDLSGAGSAVTNHLTFHTLSLKVCPSNLGVFVCLFCWEFWGSLCSAREDIWYIFKVPVTIYPAPMWKKNVLFKDPSKSAARVCKSVRNSFLFFSKKNF